MGHFDNFVSQAQAALPVLPLFHTCEGWNFRAILHENKLDISECPHFKQPLLYFFYGKPAYRPSKNDLATSANACMPIAIAVRPELPQGVERIAPFDTGAYFGGLYSAFTHSKMKCEDFLLTPNMKTPGCVVSCFFGTNKNYYAGIPIRINIPPLEFEAFSYQELVHQSSTTPYDDRRNLIEVQSKESLSLDANNVLFVVLPGIFLDDLMVKETLVKLWKTDVLHYRIHHGNPREYVSKIYEVVEEYLTQKKYF